MSATATCVIAERKVLGVPRFLAVGLGVLDLVAVVAQLAPHLPGDPEQQKAAGEQQADDGQELDRDQREQDPGHERQAPSRS